jgi:hypothetical protein
METSIGISLLRCHAISSLDIASSATESWRVMLSSSILVVRADDGDRLRASLERERLGLDELADFRDVAPRHTRAPKVKVRVFVRNTRPEMV